MVRPRTNETLHYHDHHVYNQLIDRHGMMEPIPSTTTVEMLSQFAAAGLALPSADELAALSVRMNEWFEHYLHDSNKPRSTSWATLFNEADSDSSGVITFDELLHTIRFKLHKKQHAMSDMAVKALFCALDGDQDSCLSKEEMHGFLRLGYQPNHAQVVYTDHHLTAVWERHNMSQPIASMATARMRSELAAAGIAPLSEPEVKALSIKLNEWLEQFLYDERHPPSATWYVLFEILDKDRSGFITYDELETAVRHKLRKGPTVISDVTLKSLFCVLDRDDSNQLHKDETRAFFELGHQTQHAKAVYTGHHLTTVWERHNMSQPIASKTTADMKAELAAANQPLPNEQEMASLSMKLNEWLEQFLHDERLPPSATWYILFAVVDKDHSGFITYDELWDCVRHKLHKGPKVISDVTLKSIFSVLDVDEDDQLHKSEVRAFLEKGRKRLPPVKRQGSSLARDDLRLISPMERYNMSVPIPSKATSKMKEEFAAAGVALPNEQELLALSTKLNEWLEQLLHDERHPPCATWYILFAVVDKDHSGFITYDELWDCVRHKLHKGPKVISDVTLKSLFCVLDRDDSNQLHKDEMRAFFELGRAQGKARRGAAPRPKRTSAPRRSWFGRRSKQVQPELKYAEPVRVSPHQGS